MQVAAIRPSIDITIFNQNFSKMINDRHKELLIEYDKKKTVIVHSSYSALLSIHTSVNKG